MGERISVFQKITKAIPSLVLSAGILFSEQRGAVDAHKELIEECAQGVSIATLGLALDQDQNLLTGGTPLHRHTVIVEKGFITFNFGGKKSHETYSLDQLRELGVITDEYINQFGPSDEIIISPAKPDSKNPDMLNLSMNCRGKSLPQKTDRSNPWINGSKPISQIYKGFGKR